MEIGTELAPAGTAPITTGATLAPAGTALIATGATLAPAGTVHTLVGPAAAASPVSGALPLPATLGLSTVFVRFDGVFLIFKVRWHHHLFLAFVLAACPLGMIRPKWDPLHQPLRFLVPALLCLEFEGVVHLRVILLVRPEVQKPVHICLDHLGADTISFIADLIGRTSDWSHDLSLLGQASGRPSFFTQHLDSLLLTVRAPVTHGL
ncbi:hypothetical protein AcV5_009764 [Taiwanofungus camphoratus]|nr:hypothetical protein AcV5_009764 [Antrodia cinnamomea]